MGPLGELLWSPRTGECNGAVLLIHYTVCESHVELRGADLYSRHEMGALGQPSKGFSRNTFPSGQHPRILFPPTGGEWSEGTPFLLLMPR